MNLYPVRKAQRIEEIDNLQEEIDQARDNAGYLYYAETLVKVYDYARENQCAMVVLAEN